MFALPPLVALLALGAPDGAQPTDFTVPVGFPAAPVACEYEGVFPGSGVQGQWSLRTRDGGEWEVVPASPDLLRGVVLRHVGDRPFVVVEGILRGSETRSGVMTRTRETLEATVDVTVDVTGDGTGSAPGAGSAASTGSAPSTGARPAGADVQRARIVETVERETACPGTPRTVKVGDTWRCLESTSITTSGEGPIQRPAGTVHSRTEETWTRLDDEVAEDGRVLVVLEVRSEDHHERLVLDPAEPWCPMRNERLVAGHVVGTDRRTAEVVRPNIRLPGRDSGNITLPRFGMMLLAGALFIVVLAFALSWIAGRRNARRREC